MESTDKLNEQQLEEVTGGVTPEIHGPEAIGPFVLASNDLNGEERKSNLGERRPG